MSKDLAELQQRHRQFVDERGWGEYQTPKNLAEAISIEASELLESFLWQDNLESKRVQEEPGLVDQVEEELADVVIYCLGMANELDLDLAQAVDSKITINENRFDQGKVDELTSELRQWERREK